MITKKKSTNTKKYIIVSVLLVIVWIVVTRFVLDPYFGEKMAVIRRIEKQIAEMEEEGINDTSYRVFQAPATFIRVKSAEDKRFMIEMIRNSESDRWAWTRRLLPAGISLDGPGNRFVVDVGDIRIHHNNFTLRFSILSSSIPQGTLTLSEEDSARFVEFVNGLEERE